MVTIPSQRRNDVIQQDPRHGRNQVIQKLPPLKSGIFYVDDPHEEFRAKPAPREPLVDRYHGDRNTADERLDDETSGISIQESEERVHYVPVSLLSTPPTIQPPQKPYGEIVNKDFNELFKKQKRPSPSKHHRAQARGKTTAGKSTRNSVYPLGNPYYRTPSTQYGPSRLEGVLGPRTPLVEAQPSHAFDSRSSSTWLPAESYNVHASGREIDYRQEPVIFHVRDSGELVDPSRQQPRHNSETYWEGDSAEPQAREDVRFDPHYTQASTRRPYQGMNGVCGHYVSLLECPHSNGGWKSALQCRLSLPSQCEARSRHVDEWQAGQHSLGTCKRITFHRTGRQIQMTFLVQAVAFEALPSRWRRWATLRRSSTNCAPKRCQSISNITSASCLLTISPTTLVSCSRSGNAG